MAIFVFIAGYLTVVLVELYYSPLTYAEIDLDKNGLIDPSEFLYSMDLGQREINHFDKKCIEYYYRKDGLIAKIHCK